jgi:hypothetical protein
MSVGSVSSLRMGGNSSACQVPVDAWNSITDLARQLADGHGWFRPEDGVVDYVWPGSSWRRGFGSPDATHEAIFDPTWRRSRCDLT